MYFCSSMTNLKKKILCSLKNTPCLWLYNLSADLTKKNLRKKKSPLKQKKACPYASYTECYG